jgi:hypothetical protein
MTDLPESQQTLIDDLREVDAPEWMVEKTEQWYYHDFKSPAAAPKHLLVEDARMAGLELIAQKAINGRYDP